MKVKIISITGMVTNKPINGKNYSVWNYPIAAEAEGRQFQMTLTSFTKDAMPLNVGQEIEVEKQQKTFNGQTYTTYKISPEKKPFVSNNKFQPREKLKPEDFEKFVNFCWELSNRLSMQEAPKLFDKILGCGSMMLNLKTFQSTVDNVKDVFAGQQVDQTNNDNEVPF